VVLVYMNDESHAARLKAFEHTLGVIEEGSLVPSPEMQEEFAAMFAVLLAEHPIESCLKAVFHLGQIYERSGTLLDVGEV